MDLIWNYLIQLVVDQIAKYYATYAAFVGFMVIVSALFMQQVVYRFFKEPSGTVKWIITWVLCIGFSFLGWFLNLGILEPLNVVQTAILGIITGVGANGLYSIPKLQELLEYFGIKATEEKKKLLQKALEEKKLNG